jgi:mRNA interferase RelE/StbE
MKSRRSLLGLISRAEFIAFLLLLGLSAPGTAQESSAVEQEASQPQSLSETSQTLNIDPVDLSLELNRQLDSIEPFFASGSPTEAAPEIADALLSNAATAEQRFAAVTLIKTLSDPEAHLSQLKRYVKNAKTQTNPDLGQKVLFKISPWLNLFQSDEKGQKALAATLSERDVAKWRENFDGVVSNGKSVADSDVEVPRSADVSPQTKVAGRLAHPPAQNSAFKVDLNPLAEKELKRVPGPDHDRIKRKIAGLAENPRPYGSEKMTDIHLNFYRLRQGDWRIIYQIDDATRSVRIIRVSNRREAYR